MQWWLNKNKRILREKKFDLDFDKNSILFLLEYILINIHANVKNNIKKLCAKEIRRKSFVYKIM